jgi:hypothetical protein
MRRSQKPIQLTDRDWSFLEGLFESRIMTIVHAASLFFGGKLEYARKRVRKLQTAGLVGARRAFVNQPAALFLTRNGFLELRTEGRLHSYPKLSVGAFEYRARVSDRTIKHELAVMDVKSSVCAALAKLADTKLVEFTTWPQLHEFECGKFTASEVVRPDGFFRIHRTEGAETFSYDFFVEVDRSTEELAVLIRRAQQYQEFYRSGGFAERNGGKATDFEDFPFRVLLILKNAERRNNIAERLFQNVPPILTQCWLTTFEELLRDPFGSIWIQPVDLRGVLAGTPFARSLERPTFRYIRDVERTSFIQTNIVKRQLLT